MSPLLAGTTRPSPFNVTTLGERAEGLHAEHHPGSSVPDLASCEIHAITDYLRLAAIVGPTDDCGCEARQEWLNNQVPGLGDAVKKIADPVANAIGYKGRESTLSMDLLKPDMKSLVWLAIGALVVSKFIHL
jgi:hypothetical protein